MKTISRIICVIALGVGLYSCEKDSIRASDEITTKNYSFTGFTKLDVSYNFKVFINFSDTEEKVEVKANDNLHQFTDLKIIDKTLQIGVNGLRNVRGDETLNVYITTKTITDYKGSGNAIFLVNDAIEGKKLVLDFSGTSELSSNLYVDSLKVVLSGDCRIDLVGNARHLDALLSGTSELSDYGLAVKSLKILLSGISRSYLTVRDIMDVEASGSSELSYMGDARIVHQNVSSQAKIIKK